MSAALALVTVLSTAVAFFMALRSVSKEYNSEYMDVVFSSWGKIIFTLLPIVIYVAIAILKDGWSALIYSAEFSLAATLISGLGIQEMCCGIAIKHNREISRERVSFLSIGALLVFSISLTVTVFIYSTSLNSVVAFVIQMLLFVLSIFSYFGTGAVVSVIDRNISQAKKY